MNEQPSVKCSQAPEDHMQCDARDETKRLCHLSGNVTEQQKDQQGIFSENCVSFVFFAGQPTRSQVDCVAARPVG